ncbi:unnamed protein product [Bursaphelenchus okinawaensis]|uniref:Saposin B-type domain-containing protein n=1 Tax=Bursaphelenchus okinawaensis TaxID=465554 RepID=A0A811K294_9BILA|nr:unnamed protein product [Bursaphelenchus okinawaensis]CAG9089676.1 unnamed protein product [Bursaphelenchus okinawaensis]
MKTVLFLAATLALASAAVLDRNTEQHLEELKKELLAALDKTNFVKEALERQSVAKQNPLLENPELQWKIGKFLCKPCQALFEVIKAELENAREIEREILLPTVHKYCHEKLGKIEQLEHLCSNLADDALNRLADWLKEEGSKINPERSCIVLHMC